VRRWLLAVAAVVGVSLLWAPSPYACTWPENCGGGGGGGVGASFSVPDCQVVTVPAGGRCYDEIAGISYYCGSAGANCVSNVPPLVAESISSGAGYLFNGGSAFGTIPAASTVDDAIKSVETNKAPASTTYRAYSLHWSAPAIIISGGTPSNDSLFNAYAQANLAATSTIGRTSVSTDTDWGTVSTPIPANSVLIDLSCTAQSASAFDVGDVIDFCICEQVTNVDGCDYWGGLAPTAGGGTTGAGLTDRQKVCVRVDENLDPTTLQVIGRISNTAVASAKTNSRVRVSLALANIVDTPTAETLNSVNCTAVFGVL
jgi:hypothetical protein